MNQQQQHRRSVYRLGIGCDDALAGYSHAFSIVAQPDGSFYWLQSFIGHYSLAQWMKKSDAKLSLDGLLAKLDQVQRLRNITDWTQQANKDYLQLFGVDKSADGFKWKESRRLKHFYWDEACEYPVPGQEGSKEKYDDDEQDMFLKTYFLPDDECTFGAFQDSIVSN